MEPRELRSPGGSCRQGEPAQQGAGTTEVQPQQEADREGREGGKYPASFLSPTPTTSKALIG